MLLFERTWGVKKMGEWMYGEVACSCLQLKWNHFMLEADKTESGMNNGGGEDGVTEMRDGRKD